MSKSRDKSQKHKLTVPKGSVGFYDVKGVPVHVIPKAGESIIDAQHRVGASHGKHMRELHTVGK
jgi:hypothetical protein